MCSSRAPGTCRISAFGPHGSSENVFLLDHPEFEKKKKQKPKHPVCLSSVANSLINLLLVKRNLKNTQMPSDFCFLFFSFYISPRTQKESEDKCGLGNTLK